MANTKKIDFVLLGLLSHESYTGYEIKMQIDSALKYFWGASYGSIYPTLNQMEQDGYVTKENVSTNQREKIAYTITESGRERLREWLTLPVEKDEIRYETLLKLFFGSEAGAEETIRHIEAFEKKTEQQLMELRGFEAVLKPIKDTSKTHLYYLLTVEFGIETHEAYLKWCKEVKKELKKENPLQQDSHL